MINDPARALPSQTRKGLPRRTFERAWRIGADKTRLNIRRLADEPKACPWAVDGDYFAHPEGFYEISNWTTSFLTGMALLVFRRSRDSYYLNQAQRLAPYYRLKVYEHDRDTMHDLGFLYSLYSVALHQLTGDLAHRETGLRAAQVLANRFVPEGGYIRAWGRMAERDTDYAGLAIIDSLMNLPLLYWASAQTGDEQFRHLAMRHADTTLRYFLRPDDSVCHAYRFAPASGRPLGPDNYCGCSSGSHWARGTAWAIYGFALSYSSTGEERYLEASSRLARQFLKLTADDPVPVWDFNLPPGSESLRDSSAAAIAVCGIQELLRHRPGDPGLAATVQRTLEQLCSAEYLDREPGCPGLLRQAQVGNGTVGTAVSVYASWGDYFFMEALDRQLTATSPSWFEAQKPANLTV